MVSVLEARRWFRQRLAALARQYPQLTTPAAYERLAETLDAITEEDSPCPEADRKVLANSPRTRP